MIAVQNNQIKQSPDYPVWFDGKTINEDLFCRQYLDNHPMIYTEGAFFTPLGRVSDENPLKEEIYRGIQGYVKNGVARKISGILDLMRITAYAPDFPPEEDRIHLANGTLFWDGEFIESMRGIVRSRLPICWNPNADKPKQWLAFLHQLLREEDNLTLQEFIGYCLIPSNKRQRMMIIKGSGGEGKSQIGTVVKHLFGVNAKDGSVGKVSENRFACADLEHIHVMIDDDMRMDALRQTNYVKSIVTAQGKMNLEQKGRQSYQGHLFARLLAFSNGDLQSLYDRSDGFYRRQLILTALPRNPQRVDDPYLSLRLCHEAEGILLWAFQGLQRLIGNDFRFTESSEARESRETLRQDGNNMILFMEAEDYVKRGTEGKISSQELYAVYCLWCSENGFVPLKARSVSDYLAANEAKYGIEHINTVYNADGRRVWGFKGITTMVEPGIRGLNGAQKVYTEDLPF